jgi:hypothetical protein
MPKLEADRFTVGVFQDVVWAEKGIDALKRKGLPSEALSVISKNSPEVSALIERTLGGRADSVDLKGMGAGLARGPLIAALAGADGLSQHGIAGSMTRVGFQAHDGRIYDTLVARGGVLVAIRSEPLAADALAVLLSYGGGNAAIGAWTGRV